MDFTQPAQQTALGQQGFGFVPGSTSPSRGLVLRSSLFDQPKDSARTLTNLRWDGNAWTTRLIGNTKHRAGTFNSGESFKDFGVHWLSDGTSRLVQQVGKQVQLYDPTTTGAVESVLFTASQESIPSMRSFSPAYFLYVNGVDKPQKWDGTTWSPLENWPVNLADGSSALTTPKFVEIFQYRAVFAGFSEDPYGVLLSAFGGPATYNFTDAGDSIAGYYRVPTQLGPVTAIRSFRISQQSNQEILIIGCKKGIVLLTGTGASNYQFIPVTDRFGAVSHRAWMPLDNDLLVLCTDGLRQLQGNVYFSNLVNSVLSYPVQPMTIGLDRTNENRRAFVMDNPEQLESHWYFSTGSDGRNSSCIYMSYCDAISAGQVRFAKRQYPSQVGNGVSTPSCAVRYNGLYLSGDYQGYLRKEWSGSKWADDTGVLFKYESPLFDPPTPSEEATSRAFWIVCDRSLNKFTASAKLYTTLAQDGTIVLENSDVVTDFESNALSQPVLGSWALGSVPFGGTPEWEIFEYDPNGAGRGWQVLLNGDTSSGRDFSFIGIFSTLIGGGTRE